VICMCYNCGCQRPNDDMGKGSAGADPNGKAITNKTIQAAADAFEESFDETLDHMIELAEKVKKERQSGKI
jgi:hypothetical protein